MSLNITSSVTKNSLLCLLITAMSLAGCGGGQTLKGPTESTTTDYSYTIAPGDRLDIFVWQNEDVSVSNIPVMPDGRISTPLVEDIVASGKTPMQLARDIEKELAEVIQNPFVTVTVVNIVGGYTQQVRVVGEATAPSAIPYKNNMTVLDVMIAVGGLTEFAAGNRASIVRNVDGKRTQFRVRVEDLIKRGDLSANTEVVPGDILIIPESLF